MNNNIEGFGVREGYGTWIHESIYEEIPKYRKNRKAKKPYCLEGKLKKGVQSPLLFRWYGDWRKIGSYRIDKDAMQAKEKYENHSSTHIIYSRLDYRVTKKEKGEENV